MHIIKYRKWFYFLPVGLVIASIAAVAVFGLKIGVDLAGGSLLEVSYAGDRPSVEEVHTLIAPIPLGEVRVQPSGESHFLLRMREINDAEKAAIMGALSAGGAQVTEERLTTIGPTIGKELRSKAIVALILVSLAIIAYIAFTFRKVSEPVASWKYGVLAIVTLLHDVILPVGVFALLGHFFGAEVDALFIVALLTILGISINDTIVVFDRVRESLKINQETGKKEAFEDTVGRSISNTIARSINTSLTVIIVLLALFLAGPEATKNFALTLIIGMVAGTYSSIFLASPLLVTWNKFSRRRE